MTSNNERLQEILKDFQSNRINSLFELLQETSDGTVKPFNDAQIEKIVGAIDLKSINFNEETIEEVVSTLANAKSKMARLGRTQISKIVCSLNRDEVAELINALIPFFLKYSGKFVHNLTTDQQRANFKVLFSEIVKDAIEKNEVAKILLTLYPIGRIGEALEILNQDQND
jgi:hypothetical protein